MKVKMQDLTGMTFGHWKVLGYDADKSNGRRKYWICQCNCELGTIKSVRADGLRNSSSSCVCHNKKQTKKIMKARKTTNVYDLNGEYGIGYTENGDKFYFDLEDYDLIKDYKWNVNIHRSCCVQANVNKTTIKMHRLILGINKGEIVDHINRDETDNRKDNLRRCSHSENMRNRIISSNNKTGHKGVHESKGRNRYEAYVEDQYGKRVRKIFCFSTYNGKENAYKCACEWYEDMDRQISGEFSIYN